MISLLFRVKGYRFESLHHHHAVAGCGTESKRLFGILCLFSCLGIRTRNIKFRKVFFSGCCEKTFIFMLISLNGFPVFFSDFLPFAELRDVPPPSPGLGTSWSSTIRHCQRTKCHILRGITRSQSQKKMKKTLQKKQQQKPFWNCDKLLFMIVLFYRKVCHQILCDDS